MKNNGYYSNRHPPIANIFIDWKSQIQKPSAAPSSFSPQLCAYSLFHWSGLQKEGDELKKAIWGKEKWGCGRGEATYTEKKESKGWEIESAVKSKMRNWKVEITVWIQVKATLRALLDFC